LDAKTALWYCKSPRLGGLMAQRNFKSLQTPTWHQTNQLAIRLDIAGLPA
jgi:hypothetical protein